MSKTDKLTTSPPTPVGMGGLYPDKPGLDKCRLIEGRGDFPDGRGIRNRREFNVRRCRGYAG